MAGASKFLWLDKDGKVLVNGSGQPYFTESCCCSASCICIQRPLDLGEELPHVYCEMPLGLFEHRRNGQGSGYTLHPIWEIPAVISSAEDDENADQLVFMHYVSVKYPVYMHNFIKGALGSPANYYDTESSSILPMEYEENYHTYTISKARANGAALSMVEDGSFLMPIEDTTWSAYYGRNGAVMSMVIDVDNNGIAYAAHPVSIAGFNGSEESSIYTAGELRFRSDFMSWTQSYASQQWGSILITDYSKYTTEHVSDPMAVVEHRGYPYAPESVLVSSCEFNTSQLDGCPMWWWHGYIETDYNINNINSSNLFIFGTYLSSTRLTNQPTEEDLERLMAAAPISRPNYRIKATEHKCVQYYHLYVTDVWWFCFPDSGYLVPFEPAKIPLPEFGEDDVCGWSVYSKIAPNCSEYPLPYYVEGETYPMHDPEGEQEWWDSKTTWWLHEVDEQLDPNDEPSTDIVLRKYHDDGATWIDGHAYKIIRLDIDHFPDWYAASDFPGSLDPESALYFPTPRYSREDYYRDRCNSGWDEWSAIDSGNGHRKLQSHEEYSAYHTSYALINVMEYMGDGFAPCNLGIHGAVASGELQTSFIDDGSQILSVCYMPIDPLYSLQIGCMSWHWTAIVASRLEMIEYCCVSSGGASFAVPLHSSQVLSINGGDWEGDCDWGNYLASECPNESSRFITGIIVPCDANSSVVVPASCLGATFEYPGKRIYEVWGFAYASLICDYEHGSVGRRWTPSVSEFLAFIDSCYSGSPCEYAPVTGSLVISSGYTIEIICSAHVEGSETMSMTSTYSMIDLQQDGAYMAVERSSTARGSRTKGWDYSFSVTTTMSATVGLNPGDTFSLQYPQGEWPDANVIYKYGGFCSTAGLIANSVGGGAYVYVTWDTKSNVYNKPAGTSTYSSQVQAPVIMIGNVQVEGCCQAFVPMLTGGLTFGAYAEFPTVALPWTSTFTSEWTDGISSGSSTTTTSGTDDTDPCKYYGGVWSYHGEPWSDNPELYCGKDVGDIDPIASNLMKCEYGPGYASCVRDIRAEYSSNFSSTYYSSNSDPEVGPYINQSIVDSWVSSVQKGITGVVTLYMTITLVDDGEGGE